MDFYKIPLKDLIVIYDDIDLELGNIRIKSHGSPGTHNGMRNITELLKSDMFTRIRIGVGRPEGQIELKDFVLMKLKNDEKETIEKTTQIVYKSVIEIIEHSVSSAMNLYNNNKKEV